MEYLYKSCSDIPVFNFDVIYKTNDFKYLVVGYDGYADIKVPKGANERWEEIKNEWIEMLDDNSIAHYYMLISECVYLQTRYQVVEMLLKQIFEQDGEMTDETLETYIQALAQWRYKWNRKNEKLSEIKRLIQQLQASRNKIELKNDELEKLQKENENNGDASSLEKQAVILEQITGKNNIDTRTTSVKKWIEITKVAQEINEQRSKKNGK